MKKRALTAIVVVMLLVALWAVTASGEDDPQPSYESIEVVVEFDPGGVDFNSDSPLYPVNEAEIVGTISSSPNFEQTSDTAQSAIYIVDIDTTGINEPVLNSGPFPPADDGGWNEPGE